MDYKGLIELFRAKGETGKKAWLNKPQISETHIYGVNVHAWIKIPRDPNKKAVANIPDINQVLNTEANLHRNEFVFIEKSELLSALLNIDTVPQFVECDMCEGDGVMDNRDCPQCLGTGDEIDNTKPYIYPKGDAAKTLIRINGALFAPYFIDCLNKAIVAIGAEGVYHFAGIGHPFNMQGFKVGECEVVIMPCVNDDLREEVVVGVIQCYTPT